MYVFLEGLTVLALVVVVAMLLFAAFVGLMALRQGITAMRRIARKAAEPATAQKTGLSMALQGAILTSTEPSAR
ncbi:MAG TPA: hypothetical protein VG860_06375 [Terriglobia bacterium]|nr:hypothetical protein [Terriglobia bacterium]